MDIGDIVIHMGKRYRIRGFDPAGVDPRLVYLENTKTRKTVSVVFDELVRGRSRDGELRLVDENQS
jgi:hypothetical protein